MDERSLDGSAVDDADADDTGAAPSEREVQREDIEQEKRAESEGMTP